MAIHRKASLGLSAEQARQALTVLIQEGKLAASEVRRALDRRDRLVRALKASLAALESGVVSVGQRVKGSLPMRRKDRLRRKMRKTSLKRRKAMQQQGRYLAAVRRLRPAYRAKVKAVRAEKGFAAAIAEARRLREAG